jgi:hydroxymethylpyrimidine pyrophosphatase-like HAD family hydrolase
MRSVGLFSDLDLTLIYSLNQLHKRGDVSTGKLVAEEYQNAPLSFMSVKTWSLLKQFIADAQNHFIPVTTRTFEQYSRIAFPDVTVRNAVVLNGAQIVVDGQLDKIWSKQVQQGIEQHHGTYSPDFIYEHMVKKRLENSSEVKTMRLADEIFPYVVAHSADCPEVDSVTKDIAEKTGYIRSKQGRKTYLVPKNVSKGAAVRELRNRLGIDFAFASGDSLLDFTMIPEVEQFIHPSHGDTPPELPNVLPTQVEGIGASEMILETVISSL